jgi:hypothetical protein
MCAVAPLYVLGMRVPAESIVMKALERFDVISLASASERRGMRGRYLPGAWLLLEALLREDSSLRRSLDRSAACRRRSRSARSLASRERFFSRIAW